MKNVSDFFGCKVFDDRVMKANLSAKVYHSLRKFLKKDKRFIKIEDQTRIPSRYAISADISKKGNKMSGEMPGAYYLMTE